MSTPQWFAEFERQEAMREDRLDVIRADMQRRDLIAQLVDLTKRWTPHEAIPESQERECRSLGKMLNDLGGFDLMQAAYHAAHAEHGPPAHPIAAYWANIGEWRW